MVHQFLSPYFPSVWKNFWRIPCIQEKIPIAFGYVFPFSSVQSLSHVQLFVTPWTAASQASLSITISQSLLKLMSIKSVMPSNHLILCCPLLLPPSVFPSIRVFSSESVLCIRWPKYWSFSFSISPYNEYSVLISFRMDWLDLLAVQGNLKSLLQHHSSKASILWHSAFFIVQLSHPYMTTGKTIDLTRWTFVGKVMSLLFNILSRLVIAFLPRSKRLNFMAAVIICSDFGAPQNKICHCFHCFQCISVKVELFTLSPSRLFIVRNHLVGYIWNLLVPVMYSRCIRVWKLLKLLAQMTLILGLFMTDAQVLYSSDFSRLSLIAADCSKAGLVWYASN